MELQIDVMPIHGEVNDFKQVPVPSRLEVTPVIVPWPVKLLFPAASDVGRTLVSELTPPRKSVLFPVALIVEDTADMEPLAVSRDTPEADEVADVPVPVPMPIILDVPVAID